MIHVVKQVAHRDNKGYIDYYLVWRYADKLHYIRVRPSFWKDFDKLYCIAETIPDDEPLEKYY